MIARIFLDLDDVLNSLTMSALREVGCPVGIFDYRKFDPEWGFDIVRAANALHRERKFTEEEFWSSLSEDFWRNIPASRELGWLLELCESLIGRKNICILTAVPTKVGSYVPRAKVEWIHANLPAWFHNQFLIGCCKHFCAAPNALLIDDSSRNVKAFRKHGGRAILVPRPWNALHDFETERYIKRAINRGVRLNGW